MKKENNSDLLKFRAQMRDVTKSILDLVLARQNIARSIAEIKENSGEEIENRSVEERILSELTSYASKKGLEVELASRIATELMEFSKTAQRRKIYLKQIKGHLHSSGIKSVSIFGAGRMGRWFARYFAEADTKVLVFDSDKLPLRKWKNITGVKLARNFVSTTKSDLFVAAVPITVTPRLVRKLSRKRNAKILEVASIKTGIEKMILRENIPADAKIYSIHPLFGPTANPFSINSIIQTGGNPGFVKGLFPHYKIFKMKPREHDRLMATLLTLPHVHALSFADSLRRAKMPADIHSPSYDHMLELSKKVLSESERIYFEIQDSNPYAKRVYPEVIRSIKKIQRLVENRSSFEKFFKENRHLFA